MAKKKQEEDTALKKEEEKKAEPAPAKPNPCGAALVPPKRTTITTSQAAKGEDTSKAKDMQKPVNMFLLKIQQEKELKLKVQQELADKMKK